MASITPSDTRGNFQVPVKPPRKSTAPKHLSQQILFPFLSVTPGENKRHHLSFLVGLRRALRTEVSFKRGEKKDSIDERLNLNSSRCLTPLQGTRDWNCCSNQNKISLCLSVILSPCFVLASLSLPKSCFIETSQRKKDKAVVPSTRQWSRLHSAISNVGRRQCPAEFSTCCYSSRKNVIPAALQRSISKSHLLPKSTLTHCWPFPGAETPGTNPKVF